MDEKKQWLEFCELTPRPGIKKIRAIYDPCRMQVYIIAATITEEILTHYGVKIERRQDGEEQAGTELARG